MNRGTASDPTARALQAELRRRLALHTDPERAAAQQAYMKSALPFYGVRSASVTAIVRAAVKAHPLADVAAWEGAVRLIWDDATHREERYAATLVAEHRAHRDFRTPPALALYRHLIVTGAWWDHVDAVATHLLREQLLAAPADVAPVVLDWADTDDLWLRRSAILAQIGSRERGDQVLLARVIDLNLDGSTRVEGPRSPYGREFFIRKAIGWALRDHARTDPAWVRDFVEARGSLLSGLSRREATRHLSAAGGN